MPAPDYSLERSMMDAGHGSIAGVDEVGRGALAGPVTVAAVILDPACLPEGLNDSKKLSALQRAALFDTICASARAISLVHAPAHVIDRINIRMATLNAMRQACAGLAVAPDYILIDGRDVPPNLPAPASAIVRGDGRSLSIAAASIVAKVCRDRLMQGLERESVYGFARHVGYGTAIHLAALKKFGPSRYHRLSFAPIYGLSTAKQP